MAPGNLHPFNLSTQQWHSFSCGSHLTRAEPQDYFFEEVNLAHNEHNPLVYDAKRRMYRTASKKGYPTLRTVYTYVKNRLTLGLLPSGVTSNYLRYMKWRLIQRYCKSILHVLGTTSLLMGLGINNRASRKTLTAATTSHWILKDILGKAVRVLWASRMGSSFDCDAKRWRFRASLIFMVGSALEMACRIFPAFFLLLASLGKACQQVSMLTTSSTRTVFYQALSENNNNIGDVTAKGEAQIAIVSVLGMFSGIAVCQRIGASLGAVLVVYSLLQILELVSAYMQLRAVEFKVLNMERLNIIVNEYVMGKELSKPAQVAQTERIFLPAPRLRFSRLAYRQLNPEVLKEDLNLFKGEEYAFTTCCKTPKILLRPKADTLVVVKAVLSCTFFENGADLSEAVERASTEISKLIAAIRKKGWYSPDSIAFDIPSRLEWTIPSDSTLG